jgi:CRISPR/Cas system-associated exonuclease Cas4 (RecB family)
MSTFIQQLVSEILAKHDGKLKDLCIVFPTRRAGLFFQKELAGRLSSPIWSPTIFSIQDFFYTISGKSNPDNLTLLFELYNVYRDFFPNEDFDKFYSWGEILLKDFDDIDKYLVDFSKIFKTVSDLQQIDSEFQLAEEDMEKLRLFWKHLFDIEKSNLKNEFFNYWKHLGGIYSAYKSRLEEKNIAYEGMVYRKLAEEITERGKEVSETFEHIIFAGFYALSPSEVSIIKYFADSGKATMYWDADHYYGDDPAQEAGEFFRKNKLTKENYSWKENHFGNGKKEIEIAGVPLLVGQAKYAGNILESLMKQEDFKDERTAVVLPDEKLLFPVLYSIPEGLNDINVTMGYPLIQTPLYNLFESLMTLQKNSRVDSTKGFTFYFKDVLNILNHPYIRLIGDPAIKKWLKEIGSNYIRISGELLKGDSTDGFFQVIFQRLENASEAFPWFRKILRLILETMKEQEFRFHRIESEFVYHFYTQLKRFEDVMSGNDTVKEMETFRRILTEILSALKIPFTGEPLKGLQIMGFLETRVLDFDNVIVLSVNEDVLPSSGNSPSFIPFNIRKAFGLPTYQEQHAVSAYHFYRLIQRAKRIFLLHNTETKALTTGEKSRLLLQIEYELKKKYPENISITHKLVSTKISKVEVKEICVEKDQEVMNVLSRYYSDGSTAPTSSFSPSALTAYMTCRLRYYFRYVAGLSSKEEPEEEMESATFGNVLHKTMYHMYSEAGSVDKAVIDGMTETINFNVDRAIQEEFISIDQLEGKNILFRNVIRELVKRIIESDREFVPFRILKLEEEVLFNFNLSEDRTVNLKGKIDRVDEKDGVARIFDYKTGKVGKKKIKEPDDLFTDPEFKEQFQAMYYAYLVQSTMQGKPVKSGLYTLKEFSKGPRMLNNDEVFSKAQFDEFEKGLRNLIGQILSPEVPFTQTDDTDRCTYCDFKSICNR